MLFVFIRWHELTIYGFNYVIKGCIKNWCHLLLVSNLNSNSLKACDLETKNLNTVAANHSGLGDCGIVDVDDFVDAKDVPVPMFVKHTEAILDEIHQVVCIN